MSKFDEAKIRLPDGRIAYDCAKLAAIPTEGIFIAEHPCHLIQVRTSNTLYEFVTSNGKVLGHATRHDGGEPRFLAKPTLVNIHGSTFGGSMLKIGYIGIEMHLEFSDGHPGTITTGPIESLRVALFDGNEKLLRAA